MTAHPYPDLQKKLSLLKAKQRNVQRHYLYRSLIVTTLAAGTLVASLSESWQIKTQSQVILEGDRFVADSAIFNTLKITYPQSIVTFASQDIESQLRSIPALQSVKVSKTLFFPPLVTIYLQERTPVAIALSSGKVGFLDSQGVWLEPALYNYTENNLSLIKIKVVNFKPQYSKVWSEIYSLIVAYPTIAVKEVHWDNVGNISLRANNLKVILGSNYSLLPKQFATLASFPDFTSHKKLENTAQIDLTNPDTPFLER